MNLFVGRTKYVGNGIEGLNTDKMRLGMINMADLVEFESLFLAETDTGSISREDINYIGLTNISTI